MPNMIRFFIAYKPLSGVGFLVMTLVSAACSVNAQENPHPVSQFNYRTVEFKETGYKDWGLSKEDWQRYLGIMKSNGEARMFHSHLEPAFVLGMYAKNETDKKRFAKQVHEGEKRRWDRLQAFNQEVTILKIADTDPVFDKTKLTEFKSLMAFYATQKSNVSDVHNLSPILTRPVVAIQMNCQQCDEQVRKLLTLSIGFDVYFVDEVSDKQISIWARNTGIKIETVASGTITLNRDTNRIFETLRSDVPLIFTDQSLSERLTL